VTEGDAMSNSATIEKRANGFRAWCWRCHEEEFFDRLIDAHEHCLRHECQST
jgi:hypothetical protein